MVSSHLRRGIGTGIGSEGIAIHKGVLQVQQYRLHVRVGEVGIGTLPRSCRSRYQLVIAKGIRREVGDGGEEARGLPALCLHQRHHIQGGVPRVQRIVDRHIPQHLGALVVASVGLAFAPHIGGIVVGVVHRVIGEGTEAAQQQMRCQREGGTEMHIEVGVILVLFHLEQGMGIADPDGLWYLTVAAIGIGTIGEGGIEGGC